MLLIFILFFFVDSVAQVEHLTQLKRADTGMREREREKIR